MISSIGLEEDDAIEQYKKTTDTYICLIENRIAAILCIYSCDDIAYIQCLYGKTRRIGVFCIEALEDIKKNHSFIYFYSENQEVLRMGVKLGFTPNMLSMKGYKG